MANVQLNYTAAEINEAIRIALGMGATANFVVDINDNDWRSSSSGYGSYELTVVATGTSFVGNYPQVIYVDETGLSYGIQVKYNATNDSETNFTIYSNIGVGGKIIAIGSRPVKSDGSGSIVVN